MLSYINYFDIHFAGPGIGDVKSNTQSTHIPYLLARIDDKITSKKAT